MATYGLFGHYSGNPWDQKYNGGNPGVQKYNGGNPWDQKYNGGNPWEQKYNGGNPGDQKYNGGNPWEQKYNGGNPGDQKYYYSQPTAMQAPAAIGNGFNPFLALVPSSFPPGTDPNVIACFKMADLDGNGFIDDKELKKALSSSNQSFSLRTIRILMFVFTGTNTRTIGPKEFTSVFYGLQNWRTVFEKYDKDRNGTIDSWELRDALQNLGFTISPVVLDLLVAKFDKSGGGKNMCMEYDNFIECCLTIKGLSEKFKEKDSMCTGSATFNYETFLATVLPFIFA